MNLNRRFSLALKVSFTTFLFLVLSVVTLLISLVIFKSHIHPDNWIHEWYDTVILIPVFMVYIFVISRQVSKFKTKR
jgi:hypothetical protein